MEKMAGEETANMAVEVLHHQEEEPWKACRLARRQKPVAMPSEVVVRLQCRPINPSDLGCITGWFSVWNPSLPAVLGFEGMGIIDQIGEGVTGFEVGQRVYSMGAPQQGTWQDFVVAPAANLIPMPSSIPDEVAAQFVVNPWTVIGFFEVLKVPTGDYLLQTGAGSVLGRMLIQYAHHKGIKQLDHSRLCQHTLNIVRRSDLVDELKALGADEVIVSSQEDELVKVRQITSGKMAHSAVDCVGGDMTEMAANCVRDGSTVLVYGVLGDFSAKVLVGGLIFNNLTIRGFNLLTWYRSLLQSQVKEMSNLVLGLLEKQVITPMAGEKFPLHKYEETIKKSLEPARGGKVFLVSY